MTSDVTTKVEPFERYYRQYDEWFEKNKTTYHSELAAIRKFVPTKGTGLEIGVGSGRFAVPLGIEYGLEPSKNMGTLATERGIKVVGGIAEKLPYNNESFDFILMVTVICFLDEVGTAFKEVFRVLKSGGMLIVGFIERNSFLGKLYEQKKNRNVFYKDATFFSVEEVVSLLGNAGFGALSFYQTIFHDSNKTSMEEPVKKGFGEGAFVVVRALK